MLRWWSYLGFVHTIVAPRIDPPTHTLCTHSPMAATIEVRRWSPKVTNPQYMHHKWHRQLLCVACNPQTLSKRRHWNRGSSTWAFNDIEQSRGRRVLLSGVTTKSQVTVFLTLELWILTCHINCISCGAREWLSWLLERTPLSRKHPAPAPCNQRLKPLCPHYSTAGQTLLGMLQEGRVQRGTWSRGRI